MLSAICRPMFIRPSRPAPPPPPPPWPMRPCIMPAILVGNYSRATKESMKKDANCCWICGLLIICCAICIIAGLLSIAPRSMPPPPPPIRLAKGFCKFKEINAFGMLSQMIFCRLCLIKTHRAHLRAGGAALLLCVAHFLLGNLEIVLVVDVSRIELDRRFIRVYGLLIPVLLR